MWESKVISCHSHINYCSLSIYSLKANITKYHLRVRLKMSTLGIKRTVFVYTQTPSPRSLEQMPPFTFAVWNRNPQLKARVNNANTWVSDQIFDSILISANRMIFETNCFSNANGKLTVSFDLLVTLKTWFFQRI